MKKSLLLIWFFLICLGIYADDPDFYVNALGYKVVSKTDLTCEVAQGNYGGEVYVPASVTYGGKAYTVIGIGEKAFYFSRITSLSMANTITYIAKYACMGCSQLRKVSISSSVLDIGDGALQSGDKLETVTIEDGDELLVYKGDYLSYFYAFPSKIKTLYIGRNFTPDLFSVACGNVTDLTIGDQVTTFEITNFPSLRRLTIGTGLKNIPYMETGNYLTKITVKSEIPQSCGGFNNRTYTNATLYVPRGSLESYRNTEVWSNFWAIEEYALPTVIPGDANDDGKVNVTDIVEMVNSILGNPSDKFIFEAADVNEDGLVNVTDIVSVVNIILSSD
ncbi:MAG: leucine-rich repeat protein [Prevotella sp.]|nr:leucine-rich repeat protein [Prevotella sp.]